MSKKLTVQTVDEAHQAAAIASTKANEVYEALRVRLRRDSRLAVALSVLTQIILNELGGGERDLTLGGEFREQLEPTANSYGYTLGEHPTRKDLVTVRKVL